MPSLSTTTVLFTDLVKSTDLMARIGQDRADDVRREHFGALRDVLAKHGGEEVKTLGDGMMAAFGSIADAVACAVAMQQRVERDNRRSPDVTLGLRVGLAVGETSYEDGDYYGVAVVEAARLCALAEGGEILATDLVRVLCGQRRGAVCKPRGALTLKGLPDPVECCEVIWEPLPVAPIPLHPLLAVPTDIPLAGRSAERQALRSMWERAVGGARTLVLIGGEPGVGKTRLTTELARAAFDDGGVVLAGRCDEHLTVPYGPFVEALGHLAVHLPDAADAPWAREVATILPWLAMPDAPHHASTEPGDDRLRLFAAVDAMLRGAAEAAPLMLVLDDVHWADRDTLLLLRYLTRPGDTSRILIIGTYRDTEIDQGAALTEVLAELRRQPSVERMALSGLDSAGVADLMTSMGWDTAPDALLAQARDIADETDGNAFFVTELLRHMRETAPMIGRDAHAAPPDGLVEVVTSRLARLSSEANHALNVGAVLGRTFDLNVLARVLGEPEDEVLDLIEEGLRARLVLESPDQIDRFIFAHALTQAVIYNSMSASRRARLHHKALTALEASAHPAVAELAYHAVNALAVGDPAPAVEYSYQAGREATAKLAFAQAVVQLELAVSLQQRHFPDDRKRLCELLIALGLGQNAASDPGAGKATFVRAADIARALGDADLLVRSALGYGGSTGVYHDFEDDTGPTLVREALNALPPGDSDVRARTMSHLGWWLTFALGDERVRLGEESLAMARRVMTRPTALAGVILRSHDTLRGCGRIEEQLRLADELVTLGTESHLGFALCSGLIRRCHDQLNAGALPEAALAARELEARSAEEGWSLGAWTAAAYRATHAVAEGRFADAEPLIDHAASIGDVMRDTADLYRGWQLAELHRLQGQSEAAQRVLADVARAFPSIAGVLPWRAVCTLSSDELIRWEECDRDRVPSVFELLSLAWQARTVASLGDVERAEALYAELSRFGGVCVTAGEATFQGSVDHYLGLMAGVTGDFDEASERLAAAGELYRRVGARPWAAIAVRDLAVVLRRRQRPGDSARVSRLDTESSEIARSLGMGWLLAPAVTGDRLTGGDPA